MFTVDCVYLFGRECGFFGEAGQGFGEKLDETDSKRNEQEKVRIEIVECFGVDRRRQGISCFKS